MRPACAAYMVRICCVYVAYMLRICCVYVACAAYMLRVLRVVAAPCVRACGSIIGYVYICDICCYDDDDDDDDDGWMHLMGCDERCDMTMKMSERGEER